MNSFKRNLLIGYGISFFLLLVSSIASYISIKNLLRSSELVSSTNAVIRNLDNTMYYTLSGESSQRGFLITGDQRFLEPYQGAHENAKSSVEKLEELLRDMPEMIPEVTRLRNHMENRFTILQSIIDKNALTNQIDSVLLENGRSEMENLRTQAKKMEAQQVNLLNERTLDMNRFANSTPVFILLAAALAMMITIASFFKVNSDFNRQVKLQKALQEKDADITERITIIENIANSISDGEFHTRINDEGKDILGSLAGSLNKMAANLEANFKKISEEEWLQNGIARLNEKMIGEKNIDMLGKNIAEFLSEFLGADITAVYFSTDQQNFQLSSGIGIDQSRTPKQVQPGEGIIGKCISTRKPVKITGINPENILLNYSSGGIAPVELHAYPIFYENILKSVVEIGSINPLPEVTTNFMNLATFSIGNAIHSARDHKRLQELLEETQAQSEELQAQHEELENINTELEAQSAKLQASEEELRVQQEELQQANQELEERSRLLEERNEQIQERNYEIQTKAHALEQSTRYKTEFLANMSHELRTPLNSILLLSRLLTENHEKNLSKDQIEYANVIQTSGNGLLRLIDEILDLSKIESGKMELEIQNVSLDQVIAGTRDMFQHVAKEKGLEFDIYCKDCPDTIETDKLRLEQILRNLIANALKFTAEGHVHVNISASDKELRFEIEDTGIGIPSSKLSTIFEAFQQADGSTRRKFGGTGLGLSISRELARLLGGDISVKSEEGKGSKFILALPLTNGEQIRTGEVIKANQPPEKQKDEFVVETIPEAIPDDRKFLVPGDKTILIIEDDTGFARSLMDFSRKKGYKVLCAVQGDEGIQLAKKYKPLGILLDLQLPVKSGWQVMEELKSDPETRPIPVHMMSSMEARKRGISSGAVDFINKPLAFEQMTEVFDRIEKALSKEPRKVLIVEENPKHAEALSYFLGNFNVHTEIRTGIKESIAALENKDVDCVILDMGVPAVNSYATLEAVKKTNGLEDLPIIIFTGSNLSNAEEMKIRKYADSIIIKTAHSYQRILDEVSLFLHLVEEDKKPKTRVKKATSLVEILKGKTVLIADDDVRNIFSLTRSLESYGMNVISAMDGKDAIKQLEAHPEIDVVLMDMMMPEMDGYESTARIRENPRFRHLPVIAVTAKAMTGDREKCINAGASDYITKPVDADQLISLLRVWLYNGRNHG